MKYDAKYWTRRGSSGWRVPRPQFGICVPLTEYGRTKWSLKRQRRGWRLLTGRSVDPRDWSRPGVDAIVSAVLASVRPGAIVLLHDGCPPGESGRCCHAGLRDQTLMALSRLIPELHDCGFVISSLPLPP